MFGIQKIGRYEVLNHLASGGMGQVFLARTTGLGGFERQVVVKTLDLSASNDEDDAFVTMFLDEARLVGALHHQYIAPVYEVGCDEEGRYYIVMDFVHGETAEAAFRVSGERSVRPPLSFSLTVVSCVASALDYAHTLCAADGTPLDIVHRDVSLSNIMCGHDGGVKLIDFGIAKAANRATKTVAGTLKGKIGYLAPEQIHRKNVDHRADIFALGIVLYELTTGVRAFCDPSDLATMERILKADVQRPSEVVDDYPLELERIVMRALQVDPENRFQDAAAMGRELEAYASRSHIPLGHAAIIDVMSRLFAEPRGRRRIARGSNDLRSDTVTALAEEGTPISELVGADTSTRTVTVDERLGLGARQLGDSARAQRETIPEPMRRQRRRTPAGTPAPQIRAESIHSLRTEPVQKVEVALEDRPTLSADPAHELREKLARIPLEDRPTPIADLSLLVETNQRPALPAIPPPPARKSPTGPQLPLDAAADPEPDDDAPTVIASEAPDRDDPTDDKVTEAIASVNPAFTNFANPPPAPVMPLVRFVRERHLSTDVVAPMQKPQKPELLRTQQQQMRTWLTLCALFVVAVLAACLVALL